MLLSRQVPVSPLTYSSLQAFSAPDYVCHRRRPSDILADVLRKVSTTVKDKRKKKRTVHFPVSLILEDSILDNDIQELSKQVESHGSHVLNLSDSRDRPLLLRTVMEGEFQAFKFFITHGADLYITDDNGWTALHHAVSYDDLQMATELITLDPKLTTIPTPNEYRPVDLAESPEMVSLLVEANLQAFEGEIKQFQSHCDKVTQALQTCEDKEENELVLEVLALRQKENASKDICMIENRLSNHLLHYAVEKSFTHLAYLLLKLKMTEPNLRDHCTGLTGLHIAAETCNSEMVVILKHFGASLHVKDDEGRTPKELADDPLTSTLLSHNLKKVLV